jgi:cytochrome c-type biogenesis protein CcmH/NrfF
MLAEGKSDRQILDSFIARYGERILAEPEGTKWAVLTTVPIVILLSGTVFPG